MKVYDSLYRLTLVIIILLFVSCSTESTSPEAKALMEIFSQYYSDFELNSNLIPFEQSPIPSTEQLRKGRDVDILKPSLNTGLHLPESIRIPDPILRTLATQKIVNKEEMMLLLSYLNQLSQIERLNTKDLRHDEYSYSSLDSLGVDSLCTFSHPILMLDKLVLAQVKTVGIKNYEIEKPKQSTHLKVFQVKNSENGESAWQQIFDKKIK